MPKPPPIPAPDGSNYNVRATIHGSGSVTLPTDQGHEWTTLTHREAGRVLDLAAIRSDLSAARGIVVRLNRDLASMRGVLIATTDVGDDLKARYTGAVLGYARCFKEGRREHLDASIFDGEHDLRDAHDYFMALRDKHLAHSVSMMEVTTVAIGIPPRGSSAAWRMQEVVMFHQFDVGTWPAKLIALIDQATEHLRPLVEAEYTRLRAWLTPEQQERLRRRQRVVAISPPGRDLRARKPAVRT